ncbi:MULTISPECIES: DUF503 domain-containing protein [unclassified Rhodococcus (in: high G+C Gram-positive bacteria)]|uniref:DUF503 domain-containing protein n=1 Tax=unclassified Rhodococcus (in: high G+C Gram-positive bacteria) TaxID=192944 RepID=UPI00146D63F0|nr:MULTISPECIES: DUF503 domain-containing protein [unclassified Rhodococcus (in: high G+C Gram-positive bacteria)]MCK0092109.1 DUF503 domain-containing protein [Rhodococcus sp. F64268]NLU63307.1 DUF503 domain-containing protein [Rhodococcus sp. HNM0563]HET8993736.1 DUF503 domain-containing protein [Rhodococcus sp. (in: high G+C Gram-positive bacteria)]
MYLGALELDILLGDVHSLKGKRSLIKPVLAELRRLGVSASETGDQDLHRRTKLGVAVAAPDLAHVREILDKCERLAADRPELELLSTRRRVFGPED